MVDAARPTQPFREEHEELMEHLGHVRGMMDALGERWGPQEVGALANAVDFFNKMLKPHAAWEEENLYPPVGELVRQKGRPTATMEVDHRYLVQKMGEFEEEVEGLRAAKDDAEAAQHADRVRRLGYQLEALLELHFLKEESVYLDAMDEHMDPAEVARILSSAHGVAGHHHH